MEIGSTKCFYDFLDDGLGMLRKGIEWKSTPFSEDVLFHVNLNFLCTMFEHSNVLVVLSHEESVLIASEFLDVALQEWTMLLI